MKRLILILLFLASSSLHAETVRTVVSYLSTQFLYIQAGERDGVTVGDSIKVVHHGTAAISLAVSRVSSSFSACELAPGAANALSVGDSVTVVTSGAIGETVPVQSSRLFESTPTVSGGVLPRGSRQGVERPRLRGRILLGTRYTDDRETANRDIFEPTLALRAGLEGVFSPHTNLEVRVRLRRTDRQGWSGGINERRWANRIYQLSLRHDDPDSRLDWSAGRVLSSEVAGLGVMDGIIAGWRVNDQLRVGAFTGTVPDPVTSEFIVDETQGGGFVSWSGMGDTYSAQATLAGIGKYFQGRISRESVYQQVSGSAGYRFMIFQSSEIEINRGWRRDRSGSAMSLSSLLFQARWTPIESLSLETGYDNRRSVMTWETRDTPDSLFDNAMREGWRSSLRWRGPLRTVWLVGGTIRTRSGKQGHDTGISAGVTVVDLLSSSVDGSFFFRTFNNLYARGIQPSLNLSRRVGKRIRLLGRAGQSRYDLAINGEKITYLWYGGGCELDLMQHLYLSADAEAYRGQGADTNRYAVEAGWRL